MSFPQISDDPGTVFQHFNVPGQPAFVVVSPDGSAVTELGAVEADTLDAMLTDATT